MVHGRPKVGGQSILQGSHILDKYSPQKLGSTYTQINLYVRNHANGVR